MTLSKFFDNYFGVTDFAPCHGSCLNTKNELVNCSDICYFHKNGTCLMQEVLKAEETMREKEKEVEGVLDGVLIFLSKKNY